MQEKGVSCGYICAAAKQKLSFSNWDLSRGSSKQKQKKKWQEKGFLDKHVL